MMILRLLIPLDKFKTWVIATHADVERLSLTNFADTWVIEFVPLIWLELWADETVVMTWIEGTTVNQNGVQMVQIRGLWGIMIFLGELERLGGSDYSVHV